MDLKLKFLNSSCLELLSVLRSNFTIQKLGRSTPSEQIIGL